MFRLIGPIDSAGSAGGTELTPADNPEKDRGGANGRRIVHVFADALGSTT